MKQCFILVITVFITLLSCKNQNRESQKFKTTIKNIALTTEVDTIQTKARVKTKQQDKIFDWTKTELIKEKLLSELQSPNNIDKAIMRFLDEYGKLESDSNDILFNLISYDSLNTLAYAPDGIVYEGALEFKKQAKNNGFNIAQSEGMIYLVKNTAFIKQGLIESIDAISIEFINLYCNEIDTISCEDAAIIISEKKLIERAFLWGNLLEKTYGLDYNDVVVSEFYSYLSLIYRGQDNTPSFDWTSGQFNSHLSEAMTETINNFPNSKAAKEFNEYLELLATESFKKTYKIDEYLKNKLK